MAGLFMTLVIVNIGESCADIGNPFDISIPVRFEGEQLSAFGASPAKKDTYRADGFVGDVRQEGSCNCEIYSFSPHLHGTHTECVGHISREKYSVHEVLTESLIPATLITLIPEKSAEVADTYDPKARPDDLLITCAMLKKYLNKSTNFSGALIIRTLPNGKDKTVLDYSSSLPPFFSIEAMEHIAGIGVRHLLVDFPSVDRLDDEGKLTNHHIFWGVPRGSHEVKTPSSKTITELIYVPDNVTDGNYLLNLQVAAFAGDAAPSRPLLYKVIKK